MPVVRRKPDAPDLGRYEPLIAELATELTKTDGFGQPLVVEQELPRAGMLEVNVFWDRWQGVPDRDRPAIVQQAYRRSRPADADKLAFAAGYTIPEGVEAGLLPYTVESLDTPEGWPTLGDRVRAIREVGGSVLRRGERQPELWCASAADAERYRDELCRRVPDSQDRWVIRHATY